MRGASLWTGNSTVVMNIINLNKGYCTDTCLHRGYRVDIGLLSRYCVAICLHSKHRVDSFAGFLILLGTGYVLVNIRGQLDLIFCPHSLSITNALNLRPRDAYWNECRYYVELSNKKITIFIDVAIDYTCIM